MPKSGSRTERFVEIQPVLVDNLFRQASVETHITHDRQYIDHRLLEICSGITVPNIIKIG